tara:strand:- start:1179 stop:3428 length:2250 start_codon:yes stop_codon:yes gene_type:complete
MNKILLKTLIFIYLLSFQVYAEVISKIDVEGNIRISKETIKVLGNINLNENFNNEDLNKSLKKLYDTNFFENVNITLNNGSLKIVVVENPIIEDIEITGIKNKSFLKNIKESIVLKNRKSFTENQLEIDTDTIKNILKTNGFYFASIKSSLNKNEELNSVRIKIDIDQGNKAKIDEILFIGDKKIKDKKLLEVIASEEHKFWKFISNKVYLNQSLIDLDRRLLENFYKNQGYYDVKVLNSFAELNNQDSFKLIFNIDSGNKYYFNKFSLSLPDDYNKSHFDKINKIFKKLQNEKYSLNKIELILKEIDRIASMRLYDFITAQVDETIIDDNKLNFNFKVIDSEKFYIEKINILGNFNTIEEVIRNKLIVDEGDPFNELLFEKSIDNIRSTGFFKSVKTDISDGSSQNLKVVNLSVEEKPTGEISLGAGVGTAGSTIGGGIVEKNFLGKGINLNTNLEISEETVKGQFIYSKPNFNYSDNTLFTSVSSVTEDYLTDFGYKVDNIGFSVGTTFEQKENLFFSPEINIAFEDLETNSTASNNLKKQEGSYDDLYFNYSLDYDMRDSRFRPTSGNKVSFYQEMPFISNTAELTNVFIFTQYKKLNDASNMIGKASFYAKSVNTIKDSDARISKRAQVPYKRLRGFQRGKVGPLDNNDYIGGNYVTTLNFSTNLPGILPTVENMDFSYFVDFANVWGVDYDSALDDSNSIRSSTGIGLDLLTPIGPLNFSLAQPITKKSSDKTETFRFNLGTTF